MEHAARIGERAGDVFAQHPAQKLTVILVARQGHLANLRARQRDADLAGVDFAVADFHHIIVAGIAFLRLRPALDQFAGARVLPLQAFGDQRRERRAVLAFCFQHGLRASQLLEFARDSRLFGNDGVIGANLRGDFGKIALAQRRHDRRP